MTDPRPQGPLPAAEQDGYSKDYWDIVFDQLSKRRLFQVGLAILALIYASAIYAPLIANDRPYVIESIGYREYGQARKSLYPVTLSLRRLMKQTSSEFLANRAEGVELTYEEALIAERKALVVRFATMMDYLPEEHHAPLEEFLVQVGEAIELALAGDNDGAYELGGELKDRAKELRGEYEAVVPPGEDGEASGAEGGLELQAKVSYPLVEATTPWEVFFMTLWALVLTWPLWNRLVNGWLLSGDRERVRRARRTKLLGMLGASLSAALLWWGVVGGESTFNLAPFKEGLTTGDIVAERVVFPPFNYGFSETHLGEVYRPPTWTANAEKSEEGYYVRGKRVPEADPVTGYVPEPQPVVIRRGEPALNAASRHLLGTDSTGRDLFVRALYGGRVSLAVGLVSTVILMIIGVVFGCISGYFGGWVDLLMSRVLEVVICFPVFFLILVVSSFLGTNILWIMVIIGLIRWTGVARLARGEFLKLKEQEFVIAARAMGLSSRRIVFKHMLPNAMGPLIVAATFSIAAGILVESSLSYLGFGISPPDASWGSLINESQSADHWWIQVFPGLLILVTVISYNLVGDGIRDAMDPKLKS